MLLNIRNQKQNKLKAIKMKNKILKIVLINFFFTIKLENKPTQEDYA